MNSKKTETIKETIWRSAMLIIEIDSCKISDLRWSVFLQKNLERSVRSHQMVEDLTTEGLEMMVGERPIKGGI